jgi:hypothetical protein
MTTWLITYYTHILHSKTSLRRREHAHTLTLVTTTRHHASRQWSLTGYSSPLSTWLRYSFFFPQIGGIEHEEGENFFQQRGCPPHSWGTKCPECQTSYLVDWKRWTNPWPSWNTDLSLLDFLLWGFIKRLVYKNSIFASPVTQGYWQSLWKYLNKHGKKLSTV